MTRYIVSTTALCGVRVEVEADDVEGALDAAAKAPRDAWVVGEVCPDGVDLSDDEADVDVTPAEDR